MSTAVDLAVASGREKARERLKRNPPTVEQLRLVKAMLTPAEPRAERKAS